MAIIKVQSEGINLADDFTFTGELSGHNYPAFSVLQTSDQSIPDVTSTKLVFGQKLFDTNTTFDLTDNQFTVPSGKAGKYFFRASFLIRTDSGSLLSIRLAKNDAVMEQTENRNIPGAAGTGGGQSIAVLDLSVGDTIHAEVYQNNGLNKSTYNDYTVFNGYRIGS